MPPDYDSQKYNKIDLKLPVMGEELSEISMAVFKNKDLVSDTLRKEKIWEAYETEIVIKRLKDGHCFADIGANIGYYTLIASQLCGPKGRVYAFEPEAANFKLLQINTEAACNDNVELFNLALTDEQGQQELYLSTDNSGDHRLGKLAARAHQRVMTSTGDAILSAKLDFIKIDTQGAEFKVLQGLRQVLKRNRLHLNMIVEFWPYGLSLQGDSANQLIGLLFALDMDVYIIDHQQHCLYPANSGDLLAFSHEQSIQGKESGFLNLFLTRSPVSDL